jgi:CheY-like chemotaxis protein
VNGMTELADLRVFVVEDELLVSMLVEDMLADFGCKIVGPASDIEEAILLARDGEIDVAILDVNVGGRRSFPVADILKSRGLPFAFASGYGEAGIIEAYRGAPVLQKPFLQSDLEKALVGLRSALIPSSPD